MQQYNLFKLQANEPSIWIILFLSGCLSINLLSFVINKEFLLFTIASLITISLTHFLSKKYYVKTTPALYAISSIVFGISSAVYLGGELKPATEVIMIVPVILFGISHYIKSKTILFVACASCFCSILVIFGERLIDNTNTLLITCGTLLIGIVILIFGMKANKREQNEVLHSNKTGK
ncbi:MAG: hypothetical protein HOI53_09260 [Francisellaceae bacterium]|nr:hypothetical protein [Francisellaceae bacterium]